MLKARYKSPLILLTVLTLPAMVGCADPAADAPKAVVEDAAPTVEEGANTDGVEYAMTSDSTITFVGSKVTGSHDGGFESFTGAIWLVDGDPASSSFEVAIDTTSIWTDTERLTGHLKSADFFEVETYPTATFTSTAIEAADEENGYTVTGNLDLHGVTKQISFPASIEIAEGEIKATAEFAIKRFDFDIVYPGKAEDLIRDDVLIKLDLAAAPAG
jgi:polyisoprenoid-binding protein YceI